MMEGLPASDQRSPVLPYSKFCLPGHNILFCVFHTLPFNRVGCPGEMDATGEQKPGQQAGEEPVPSSSHCRGRHAWEPGESPAEGEESRVQDACASSTSQFITTHKGSTCTHTYNRSRRTLVGHVEFAPLSYFNSLNKADHDSINRYRSL